MSALSARLSRNSRALFERRMHIAQQYTDRARSCEQLSDIAAAEYFRMRADEISAIAHREHAEPGSPV